MSKTRTMSDTIEESDGEHVGCNPIVMPPRYVSVCPSCQHENVMDQQFRQVECGHCGVEFAVEYEIDGLISRDIRICRQCYELEGKMCHNPACVFCRRSMDEVGTILDLLMIRPVIDGERERL